MNLPPNRVIPPRRDAFTLIELIGALAIATILAAALAPPAVEQFTRYLRDHETRRLDELSDGLRSVVRRQHVVPGPTNLAAVVAAELGWMPGDISTNVFDGRRILFDDGFRVGAGAGSRPPYAQAATGSALPARARVIIASSVGAALPASLQTGFLATNTFDSLWNTAPGQVPAGWTWRGNAADLTLQRINLEDLFVEVILNNQAGSTGRFSLDGGTTNWLSTNSLSTHLIVGTRLGLHKPDGTLQSVEVITEPVSFVHANGQWEAQISGAPSWTTGSQLAGCDLQEAVEFFLTVPQNPRSTYSPYDFTVAMGDLMQSYIDYANSGFSTCRRSAYQSARTTLETMTSQFLN